MARSKVSTVKATVTLSEALADLYADAARLGVYGATPAEVMRYILTNAAETNPTLSQLMQKRVDAMLAAKKN